MDSDSQAGPHARIAEDLGHVADADRLTSPRRDDGYDLTDWLLENPFPSPRLAELLNEEGR